jgi:hypothetical protein
MGRLLTSDERKVLAGIASVVRGIIDEGTVAALTATGVLDGVGAVGANAPDYVTFQQRFARLEARLDDLMGLKKVVVAALPATMGANAQVGVADDGSPIAELQLRESFLDMKSANSLTDQAVTLMHELSHCLFESPKFPVKDYAYQNSWAHRYLAGAAALENADNYADAAARLAEHMEHTPKRYAETGRVAYQRRFLRQAPLTIGPALAWADIKINRVWLRASDYEDGLAKYTVGTLSWNAEVARWTAHQPNLARLLELEGRLQGLDHLIGDRWGVTYGLSGDYHRTAANMTAYMAALKGALRKVEPVLVTAGNTITYDPATNVLSVPYALAGTQAVALGDLIVDTLVQASSFTDATDVSFKQLNAHRRDLVYLFSEYDRPQELARVQQIKTLLTAVPAGNPPQATWTTAGVDLDLEALDGFADVWASNAVILQTYQTTHNTIGLDVMQTLPASMTETTAKVTRIVQRLAANGTARRRATVTAMIATLDQITQMAVQRFQATAPAYQQLRTDLLPHA